MKKIIYFALSLALISSMTCISFADDATNDVIPNEMTRITNNSDNLQLKEVCALTTIEYPKIDRMKMRRVSVSPRWQAVDGTIFSGGITKSTQYYSDTQQSIGLILSEAERIELEQYVANKEGCTLLGYRTTITYEITGESDISCRKIVATSPVSEIISRPGNGVYTKVIITTKEDPSTSWRGGFHYYMQFDSKGMRNTYFGGFTTFK